MLPLSLTLVALVGLVVALSLLLSLRDSLDSTTRAIARRQMWSQERAGFFSTRSAMSHTAQTTAQAVQLASAVTRFSHRAIASIPFGVLNAIPATRPASRRVQMIHNDVADAVYAAIDSASGGAAEAASKRLLGDAHPVLGELLDAPPPPLSIETDYSADEIVISPGELDSGR